jgi:uncharacterized membrane protein
MEGLILLGFVLIFIGIFLIIIASLLGTEKGETKVAVGGFIGPIPFGFANDKNMLYIAIVLTIIMLMLSLFLILSHKYF